MSTQHFAGGSDYIPVSGSFTFNDQSARGFCLSVSIVDDQVVELSESFSVCAASAQQVHFSTQCTTVNILDNDGIKQLKLACVLLWNPHNFSNLQWTFPHPLLMESTQLKFNESLV